MWQTPLGAYLTTMPPFSSQTELLFRLGVTHAQLNELWQSHFLSSLTGLQWVCDHFLASKGDFTVGGGSLGKIFLLHKNGSCTAFLSLPACTMTSEDVKSGAVATTL